MIRKSNFPGYEGVLSPPISKEESACIDLTDLETAYGSSKDGASSNTPSGQVAVPSRATVQPADMHRGPKGIYPCDTCGKKYTQQQGVTRHQRDEHRKSLCPICNRFIWSRRYQLTKHLKQQHPDIILDKTLRDVTRYRREAAMNKRRLQKRQASPAVECDRRRHSDPLPRSLMHPLPAVAKDSHVSLHAILSTAYDPYPEQAEKPVTSCKREDARWLGLFDPGTNAPSASSSTEDRPQQVNDAGMFVHYEKIWWAYPFFGWHMISDP